MSSIPTLGRIVATVLWKVGVTWGYIRGTTMAYLWFSLHGINPGVGLRVCGSISLVIHRTAKVTIGRRLHIIAHRGANPVGAGNGVQIWVGPNAELRIGDEVGISHCRIVCLSSITIGAHSMLGGGSSIYDSDFHSLNWSERYASPPTGARHAPILIGPEAFVGAHSIVLKGRKIGRRAIVGAGAVVTADIPDDEIWGGNPIRYIRRIN